MKLINADKLSADMYHEAFEKDSNMQKWDSGCWIRYKMFENVLKAQPAVEAPDINVGNMDTTTHDSIPAETGKNNGDKTSGDCISRTQAIDALRKMQTYKLFAGDDMLLIDQAVAQTELMMLPPIQPERKTGRWIKVNGKTAINCSACYQCSWSLIFEDTVKRFNFCPNCGADMRGKQNGMEK